MHVTGGRSTHPSTYPDPVDPVRAAVRFPMKLPVILQRNGTRTAATTVDVSSTGILFSLDAVLEVGTELDWELRLPAESMGTGHDISVFCHGRVAWVHEQTPVRMAVTIDQYQMKERSL